MSALRIKDNQLFKIWIGLFVKDNLLDVLLSHLSVMGHPGQVGHCIELSFIS
jgi:hypothetical protein